MDGVTRVPAPVNEPVHSYAPGSPERAAVEAVLAVQAGQRTELPMTIGGREIFGGGDPVDVVQPHARHQVLGTMRGATHADAQAAIDAALAAAPAWRELSFDDRAAIFLAAADLLSGPWRQVLNGATMLGQSKTAYQAEIDAACELIDFWRFNVHFARQILEEQPPANSPGVWNRTDHRPLEGFVYAITPFNFTAIAGNLPTAPALMGNTVVWKPSPTQTLAAHLTMRLLELAGLPPGVINLVTGDGVAVSDVALTHRDLAGIHFTGSTATFRHLWRQVATNLDTYRTYPRLVGETGGKDFVLAHPSADVDVLRTALVRGAFEYQGQKCSAASRAYVPRSLWGRLRDDLASVTDGLTMGPVTDLSNFMGAVIDGRAFAKHVAAIERAKAAPGIEVLAGGRYDDTDGWFVRPTVLVADDPIDEVFTTEYFGPILAIHVYDDARYDETVRQLESAAPYALTGAVIARDRAAVAAALHALRFAAGNVYVNDKPTGAVVGQQPFGGARASGTNDKAGAPQNLLRWTSTRSIKETFVPPTDHTYPHMR
jgi:1-pyrroline-5-carboxylate dehydrogenase